MRPRPKFVSLAAATLIFLGATLPSHGQNQQQMTQQAEDDFEKVDAELTAVYDQVTKAMSDEVARHKLVNSERAWIKFRDAQAEFDSDYARGGTLQSQIYAMSEDSTTRTRIAQLKQVLKDLQAQ